MIHFLSSSLFPILLTLLTYQLGLLLQRRFRTALCNPILLSVIMTIIILRISGLQLTDYQNGTKAISWLMTPATVCLAIPMYEQYQALKKQLSAIIIGVCAGTISSLLFTLVLCLLFNFSDALTVSLLPKSITSAIGVPLAEMSGGIPAICTAAIIITGILGNMTGTILCKLFRIESPIAQGVAFGTASHVIGTTRANEVSPLVGAVSSLSLVIAGLITAVLYPVILTVH